MNPQQIFEAWAPPDAPWSAWAKPVLFAQMAPPGGEHVSLPPLPDLPWVPSSTRMMALIAEFSGETSALLGLALAREGYQPVPVFNACLGPNSAVDLGPLMAVLRLGAETLKDVRPSPSAPPAFLLDARRMAPSRSLAPGVFDNRSVVLPQDFPSANLLLGRGITQVAVVRESPAAVAHDLALVLRRWQDAGIQIHSLVPSVSSTPDPITVAKPRWYRWMAYRVLMLMGLRRNSAGGFGGAIPYPSSGTG